MRKIVFVNDEKQTEYRDIPANVFDVVENLMDIYSDISRDKVDCEHTDCNNCVNHKYCDYEPNCSEIPTGSTIKNDLAQERYQDLKEYFGDKETAETILEDRKEFKAWLERIKWHVKRADELARELEQLKGTTKNNLGVREFKEIVVEYPPEDSCAYPEYKEKPYFSIKYEEGNDCIIGYGTYNPQVLSRYLKDYFMPTTKNDLSDKGLRLGEYHFYEGYAKMRNHLKSLPSVTPFSSELEKNSKKLENPTAKNDSEVECIKKSDAINIIQDMHGLARADVVSDAVNRIIELPSVTPQEPKVGHWILRNSFLIPYKCSECNYESERYDNYCPNCGAKMVEPQESEDKE